MVVPDPRDLLNEVIRQVKACSEELDRVPSPEHVFLCQIDGTGAPGRTANATSDTHVSSQPSSSSYSGRNPGQRGLALTSGQGFDDALMTDAVKAHAQAEGQAILRFCDKVTARLRLARIHATAGVVSTRAASASTIQDAQTNRPGPKDDPRATSSSSAVTGRKVSIPSPGVTQANC